MTDKPKKDQPQTPFRQSIPLEGNEDLNDFLSQLGEDPAEPAEKKSEEPSSQPKKETPAGEQPAPSQGEAEKDKPLTRYEELRRQKGVTMGKTDLTLFTEFSQVIGKIHAAQQTVEELRKAHPETFPERMYNTWMNNLKETHMIMMREFYALRNGLKEKKYDPQCVCAKCNSVFMVPLPPDRLCDECRSQKK